MTRPAPRYLERTPEYRRNLGLVRAPHDPCERCGRPVKPGRGRMIEVTIDRELLRRGDPRSGGPESQGGFAVGLDCARIIGADYCY